MCIAFWPGFRRVLLSSFVLLCGAGGASWAQAGDDETPKTFAFDTVVTSHILSNVRGGVKQGTQAIYSVDLTGVWTGQGGWDGFVYVIATGNDGFSENYVGDEQVVSNIDLPPGMRLAEAWVRKTSADQKFVTTAGFINANNMFDVQDAGALFLNSSHGIGIDFGQGGASGKPIAAFGIVQEWRPSDGISLRASVFDGVGGDPEHGSVFAASRFSADEGLQIQVEAEKDFKGGFVKLGHWGNTRADDRFDGLGRPRKASGTYGQVSATLSQEAGSEDQGLQAWLRLGVASASVLHFDRYSGGGLVYTGPIKGRDHDQVGIAIASARYGKPYRATVEARVTSETSYEASYQYEVKPGFVIQPDIQYVQHPSGRWDVKDAVVIGVQVRIGLEAFSPA